MDSNPLHFLSSGRLCLIFLWASVILGFASDWVESQTNTNQPARVVIIQDPRATHTFVPDMKILRSMMDLGLKTFWQTSSASSGWKSRIDSQDVIGIRVHSSTGKTSGTRPEVAAALIQSLLQSGHSPDRIILWDRHLASLKAAGYLAFRDRFGIRVLGARDAGYDGESFYESPLIGTMVWGDREFGQHEKGQGRKSFVSNLLTKQITKIINLTPLLNHNLAGVNGNLFGLAMAAVDNTLRFESLERLSIAVPEINALPELSDRILLNIVDALIVQYQGQSQARLQDSVVLNQLRFSSDPVALDTLSLEELKKQRSLRGIPSNVPFRIYENASLLQIGTRDPRHIHIQNLSLPNP